MQRNTSKNHLQDFSLRALSPELDQQPKTPQSPAQRTAKGTVSTPLAAAGQDAPLFHVSCALGAEACLSFALHNREQQPKMDPLEPRATGLHNQPRVPQIAP